MRSSVVFPAPLGPSSPVMPGMMSNVTSLTATTAPNQRDTAFTLITGAGVGAPGTARSPLSLMASASDTWTKGPTRE
jgi:hypothetical protein